MFKVNNRSTRAKCEVCSELTIKTSERRHWRRSGVFIVNFEDISHLVLVLKLLTLTIQLPTGRIVSPYNRRKETLSKFLSLNHF